MEFFELTPMARPKNFPRGFGLCAYSEDGKLFVNSIMVGMSANSAFLACSFDGQSTIAHGDKVLVPIEWAIRERSDLAEGLRLFKQRADEVRGAEGGRN
jgi:hypothetical protein